MSDSDDLNYDPALDSDEPMETLKDLDLSPRAIQGLPIFWKGVAEGRTLQSIADDIGVSRHTLWEWRQKQDFMDGIKKLYDKNLIELLPKVMKKFSEKLSGDVDSNSVDVAKTILKASGMMEQQDEQQKSPPIRVVRPDQKTDQETEEAESE